MLVEATVSNPLVGKTGRVCDELERRLARGYYKFGEAISTNTLVEEFQTSRAPVTAALSFLRAKGYLIITPQVGCEVVSPSATEINDFFHFFGKVEGVVAALAAERNEAGDADLLSEVCARIKKITPKKREEMSEDFLDLIGRYHHTIREIARSPMVVERAASYWRMHEFLLFNGTISDLKGLRTANRERAQIVQAIVAHDSERAAQLMETHVRGKPKRTGTLR